MTRQKGYGTTLRVTIFVPHDNDADFKRQVKAGKRAEEIVRLFSDLADTMPDVLLKDTPVKAITREAGEQAKTEAAETLQFLPPAVA